MGLRPGRLRAIAILILLVAALAAIPVVAGGSEAAPAARCFRLIALFDGIVVHRLDHRLLQIEAWELAEARRRRHRAEAYCRTGRYWFGIGAIEDALERIGVSPALGADEPPADER